MKKLLLACSVSLFGCLAAVQMTPIVPTFDQVYSVQLDNAEEAAVGSVMIAKNNAFAFAGFEASSDFQPQPERGGLLQFDNIQKGSKWRVIGRIDTSYVLKNDGYMRKISVVPFPAKIVVLDQTMCLIVNDGGEADRFSWCSKEAVLEGGAVLPASESLQLAIRKGLPVLVGGVIWPASGFKDVLDVYPVQWTAKPAVFLKKSDKILLESAFKQELIYNGKIGNTIKISYREFKNDFARPAFTQEIVYDLSESNVIGFKGMRIEVVEANNSLIKFIVKTPME